MRQKSGQSKAAADKVVKGIRRKTRKHYSAGCCQTNSNQSQFAAESVNLCGTKLAPLSKSGVSVELEIISTVESTLLIEMVVNGRVDCDKFL